MNLALSEIDLPVRLRLERPMTDEELMRFCAANETLRVEREPNGEILLMTPAGSRTSRMNSRIKRYLDEWAEADGRGVAFDSNGGFTLPYGSMRAPDGAWVELRRWQALSEKQQTGYAPVCPDFVIELVSPSDRLHDVEAKMERWAANGAEVGWLIDPERKVVEIFRSGAGGGGAGRAGDGVWGMGRWRGWCWRCRGFGDRVGPTARGVHFRYESCAFRGRVAGSASVGSPDDGCRTTALLRGEWRSSDRARC